MVLTTVKGKRLPLGGIGPRLVLCHRIFIVNKPPCGYTSNETWSLKWEMTTDKILCLHVAGMVERYTRFYSAFMLFIFLPLPAPEYFRLSRPPHSFISSTWSFIQRQVLLNRFCDRRLVGFERRVCLRYQRKTPTIFETATLLLFGRGITLVARGLARKLVRSEGSVFLLNADALRSVSSLHTSHCHALH